MRQYKDPSISKDEWYRQKMMGEMTHDQLITYFENKLKLVGWLYAILLVIVIILIFGFLFMVGKISTMTSDSSVIKLSGRICMDNNKGHHIRTNFLQSGIIIECTDGSVMIP